MQKILSIIFISYFLVACSQDQSKLFLNFEEFVDSHQSNIAALFERNASKEEIKTYLASISRYGCYSYIVNYDGVCLLHPISKFEGTDLKGKYKFIDQAITQKEGRLEYVFKGQERVLVIRNISAEKIIIFYSTPKESLSYFSSKE